MHAPWALSDTMNTSGKVDGGGAAIKLKTSNVAALFPGRDMKANPPTAYEISQAKKGSTIDRTHPPNMTGRKDRKKNKKKKNRKKNKKQMRQIAKAVAAKANRHREHSSTPPGYDPGEEGEGPIRHRFKTEKVSRKGPLGRPCRDQLHLR